MKRSKTKTKVVRVLRQQADKNLRHKRPPKGQAKSEVEVCAILHELQVRQTELEMHNEGLLRAQAEAQTAAERYAELFDFAPAGHFVLDGRGVIREVNLAGAALLGLDRKRVVGKPLAPYVESGYRPELAAFSRAVREKHTKQTCELRILKDGQSPRDVLIEGIVAAGRSGGTQGLRLVVMDITERKRGEEALRLSQERLKLAQQAGRIGAFDRNLQTNETIWTEELEAIYGLPPGGFKGSFAKWVESIHPEDRAAVQEKIRQGIANRSSFQMEFRIFWPDASSHWVAALVNVVCDDQGQPLRTVGVSMDITDRKRAEEALHKLNETLEQRVTDRTAELRDKARFLEQSEERYRSLVTASAQMIWTTNPAGEVSEDLPTWRAFTGQTYEEIKGWGWAAALHPDDVERTKAVWTRSVKTRTLYEVEYRVRRHDGEYRHMAARGVPVIEKDGSIREWIGACTDITERKTAEERRSITHALLDLFAHKGSNQEYLAAVLEVIRHWTDCHCLGIRVVDDDGDIPYCASVGFDEKFLQLENRLSLKTDNCCCIRAISQPIEDQDSPLLTPGGSMRCDNTAEFVGQLSPQQQARYRGNCFNAGFASVVVIPIRFHDRVLGALHLADRRPAYFPLATIQFLESMMPLMGEAIQRFQTKAELARHRDRLEVLVQQRTRQLEAANARLDGIISSAMDAVISIDSKQRVVLFNEAAVKVFGMSASEALGQPLERFIPEQFRATHAHHVSQFGQTGATSRAMGRLATLSGLRANGQPFPIEASISKIEIQEEKQFTVVLRDITERKKAEEALQQATKELERSNADLQQFASVASHDLQEPIRAVAGYVKLLQLRVPDKLDAKAIEYITGAVDGAARMEKLISDLLTFSRIGTRDSDFGPADLNLVVSDALDNLRASINAARAKVTTDDLPTLPVNASQMTRLFQNLIGNALKFRGERLPEIHVGVQKQNGRCIISVRDNGIGIGPQHFDRIFQIFQRLHTRKSYPGTGIGLAVCKRIVERHGGTIWVESQPGEGSTFHLSLPQSRVG